MVVYYNDGRLLTLKAQWRRMVTFQNVQCHPGLTYIFNFRRWALWRSGLSTRVPKRQKLKMLVRPGWSGVSS